MRLASLLLVAAVFAGACDDDYIPPRTPHAAASAAVAAPMTPAERREAACKAQSLPPPAAPSQSVASAEAPHGVVARVDVEGASDEARARAALGIAKGDAFDAAKAGAAIRHLYELGDADDVHLEARTTPQGVELRYTVRPKAKLGEVVIHGGSLIDVPELERALHAKAGGTYEPATVASSRAALVDSLHQRGYLDASLNVVGIRTGGDVDLCVELHEGAKVTVDRVAFSGISRIKEEELRALIDTDGGHVNAAGGVLDPGKLDDAIVKMNTLYFDRGMIRASVTGKTQRNADKVSITFTVEEGPVFTVRRYEITGDMVGDAGAYRKLLSQRSKEPFSPAKLDADMHKIAELDEKRGRKDLQIQPDTHIDDKNNTVDVVLHVVDPKKVQAAPPPPPKPKK